MGYSMQTNALLCISCKACEVHCKVKNAVPKALKLGVHLQLGPTLQGERFRCKTCICHACSAKKPPPERMPHNGYAQAARWHSVY